MSTSEVNKIKVNLIAGIDQLSDGLKNSRSKNDWWDELSTEQQNIILSGFKDAENGKLHSSEDFWKKLKNK